MKQYNISYCRCNNFGDELNISLFEKMYDVKMHYSSNIKDIDALGIGSILDGGYHNYGQSTKGATRILKNLYLRLKTLFCRQPLTVLGSGATFKDASKRISFIRKMNFLILRGELTQQILLDLRLLKHPTTLGDVGILSSYLKDTPVQKKYELGIVPHFRDLDSPLIWKLYEKYHSSCRCINVQDSPESVIEQISQCKRIVSTSLHGLIVADSLNVPNLWLENPWIHYPRNVEDYRFKFKDYYSSLGVKNLEPVDILDFLEGYAIDDIEKLYPVDVTAIESKKKELKDVLDTFFEH